MHGADEERRIFSFDEELAKEGKVGANVPIYHVGRGGVGNRVVEGRRGSEGESVGSKGSEGLRGSLEWIRGLGRKA